MSIEVRHDPSFIDYGNAIAQAAEQQNAAERLRQYADQLRQVQGQNQSYQLGLGELGIKQQGVNQDASRIQQNTRALDLEEFRNNLASQELGWKVAASKDENLARLLAAQGQLFGGYSDVLRGMQGYGYR